MNTNQRPNAELRPSGAMVSSGQGQAPTPRHPPAGGSFLLSGFRGAGQGVASNTPTPYPT